MKLHISVIGAGIGGLASAIRLAARGHDVTVFEQSDKAGGKINELRWGDFRWDSGPSQISLPELLEELYHAAEEEMKLSSRIHPLDVLSRYYYEDGLVLDAYGDPDEFIAEASKKTGEKGRRIRRYLRSSSTKYELTRNVFVFGNYNSFRRVFSSSFLRMFVKIWQLQLFSSMHALNRRSLKSPHLVQLFDRYASYNGSNPYAAPGTLNLLSHLEHNRGKYYPEKGMYNIADELFQLALRVGVRFEFDQKVEKIVHMNKVIKGLVSGGNVYKADIVISDIDIYYLYKELLPDFPMPRKYFKTERSSSAIVFYWAIDRTFPKMGLHNVLFSADYKDEFDQLFSNESITMDPTVCIYISSKIVESDAAGGRENWSVMINAPSNSGQDWDTLVMDARKNVLAKMKRILGEDIEKHILQEIVRDPRNMEAETLTYMGSLYGNSNNRKMSAFKRHPNSRKDLHGLYFVGGSVHPGGGMPLCLASAKIVDRQIVNHYY